MVAQYSCILQQTWSFLSEATFQNFAHCSKHAERAIMFEFMFVALVKEWNFFSYVHCFQKQLLVDAFIKFAETVFNNSDHQL